MTRALMTGITGLRTHQQQLDVVANNLANMNTIGFKSQTTIFSDLMYNTMRTASDPSDANGGINPQSIGSGVQMAQIARRFTQGTLQATGEILDFAIQGEGFFTLKEQSGENVYSRAGSFTVDSGGRLVDPSTGFRVQRFGPVGEPTVDSIGFQIPGDDSIRVPLGANIAGEQTQAVEFAGNLPSSARQPAAEIIGTISPLETATGPADLTTAIADLNINTVAYVAGDQIELNGTSPDGTPFTATLAADTATIGEMITELNNQLTGATASLAPDGTLSVTADDTGEAFLSLLIRDATSNVGQSNFTTRSLYATTEGYDGDKFDLSMDVFDGRGQSHRVSFEFSKSSGNVWDIEASMNAESGVITDPSIASLTFNDDGSFAVVGGTGAGDANIEISFNSIGNPQLIDLDFQQLNHLASDFSLTQRQDGFPPGTLVSLSVSSEGQLSGLASNGKSIALAQLALASFTNDSALEAVGSNFFKQSLNSGEPSIGDGASEGRGLVIGGQLESSNVDIAQEFTQLIVAQRGFSANARTITVADEMLEELTNIVR